jgi:hypothetical protein
MTHIPDAQEAKERMDKVAELLILQSESKRSRGVLLKLFQAFASVKSEKDRYQNQIGEYATKTIAWADGYLKATIEAIDSYLHARFAITGITPFEIESICNRSNLAKLFHEFGPRTQPPVHGPVPATTEAVTLPVGSGNDG